MSPDHLSEFVRLFNDKKFFQSHETLETLWKSSQGPAREFYQGLIQSAVCLHHAQSGNRQGAQREFDRASEKFRPFLPAYMGIDLATFSRDMARFIENPSGEPPKIALA